MLRPLAAAMTFAVIGTIAPHANALDPFEIQVYDGTANKPGEVGLELHVNRVATGFATATPPELPLRGQLHLTLEPSYGVFPWWEVGAYLQSAVLADGSYEFAGAKLRSKFVAPRSLDPHLRLGLNIELAYLPATFDRDNWSGELRPILGWSNERWLFIVNPIVGVGLAGQSFKQGPTFEPAAKIAWTFAETFAVGGEYYGSIGPIASPSTAADQIHELFGVLDVEAFPAIELELGLGGGLTPASASAIGKIILGITLDPRKPRAGL